jgi:hypothetical protein
MLDYNISPPIIKFLSSFLQNVVNTEQTIYICTVDYVTLSYMCDYERCLNCKLFFSYNSGFTDWNAAECDMVKKRYPSYKIILIITSSYAKISGKLFSDNQHFQLYSVI